jgi:DNA-directed RNA polymerase subunit RPC12/RpoP
MPLDEYKCWQCGKELTADGWEPQKRVFCEACEKKHREEYQKTVSEYVALKIRVMYERALREMENANCYMHEYYDIAPEILADALETPNKYQSADEMIAAMVLMFVLMFRAMYRYRLATYVMADQPETGVNAAIRRSKEIMKGRKMELFSLELSFIGWRLLEQRFGGWNEALQKAGLIPAPKCPVTKLPRILEETEKQKELYRQKKAEKKLKNKQRMEAQARKRKENAKA